MRGLTVGGVTGLEVRVRILFRLVGLSLVLTSLTHAASTRSIHLYTTAFLNVCNLDILAVTETWHSNDQNFVLSRAVPSDYTCLAVAKAESDFIIRSKTITDFWGGGVAVIHEDCWKSRRVNL